jgi:hypothetical protein
MNFKLLYEYDTGSTGIECTVYSTVKSFLTGTVVRCTTDSALYVVYLPGRYQVMFSLYTVVSSNCSVGLYCIASPRHLANVQSQVTISYVWGKRKFNA